MIHNKNVKQSASLPILNLGGKGVNFQVEIDNTELPAFVIRHGGIAYAYLNQCAHLHLELDWERGEFFDIDAEYIVCANHGAMFEPSSGECINGPLFWCIASTDTAG